MAPAVEHETLTGADSKHADGLFHGSSGLPSLMASSDLIPNQVRPHLVSNLVSN